MKHLLAMMALCVAFAAGAQTGLVEFPYNPDSDSDDLIGTVDLLELLSLFGGEFSEEGLYLNDDTTHAIMNVGTLNYPSCMTECRNLPGSWHIANQQDLMLHYDELAPSGNSIVRFWLYKDFRSETSGSASRLALFGTNFYQYDRIQIETDAGSNSSSGRLANSHKCYCATEQNKRIEYDACLHLGYEDFWGCANEKIENGWYPLSSSPSSWSSAEHFSQAFWRWAE